MTLNVTQRGSETSVDYQIGAADERGALGCKKLDGVGDLKHRGFASKRRLPENGIFRRLEFEFQRTHWSRDEAGQRRCGFPWSGPDKERRLREEAPEITVR